MTETIGEVTISNDGATIMKLLDIVHPAAQALVDIAKSQDSEVGDGTTTVVVLAGELLKEVRGFIEEGINPRIIARGYREGGRLAVERINQIAVKIEKNDEKFPSSLTRTNNRKFRELLEKFAATAMSSKLIHSHETFFVKMVVDAVLTLDQDDLDEKLIGVKKIPGGAMQVIYVQRWH
jgi:T-complex protein 1 subunit eta